MLSVLGEYYWWLKWFNGLFYTYLALLLCDRSFTVFVSLFLSDNTDA